MNPFDTDPPAIVRPAADAKAELESAFLAFEESGRKRLEAAFTIGRILAERKAAVGHGNWLPWLAAHFRYGRNRAAEFIRVYENRAKCIRAETFEEAIRNLGASDEPPANVVEQLHLEPEPEPDEPPDDPEPEPPDDDATPLEEPASEPDPIRSPPAGPAPVPSWFKPGNNADPDHPFADLLARFAALSAALTKAMATEEGKKLVEYLLAVQREKPACPPFVWNRDQIKDGKHYGPQFVGFRGLRRLVRLAGLSGNRRAATLLKEFTESEDDE